MTKKEFYYPSVDGKNKIHAIRWEPEGEPKAILQIIHGMVEFIDRYDGFASFLAEHGFLVTGEDHLGHGLSVQSPEYYGYFGDNGNACVISDIHQLRIMMTEEFPDTPYLMMGHSMGSFLIRQYITEKDARYAEDLKGVIVMGTGWTPEGTIKAGMAMCRLFGIRKPGKKVDLLQKMAFGSYLSRIPDAKSKSDWLSKDRAMVDKYEAEPMCQFAFTPNGYYNMFSGMLKAQDTKRMSKLPEGLPILFTAGEEDPVGNWGEGVRQTYKIYGENTRCALQLKMYPGDRHEILNETDRDVVYKDMLDFLESCL